MGDRERVLEMLRTAGEAGCRVVDMWYAGLKNVHDHVDSWRQAGYQIAGFHDGDKAFRFRLGGNAGVPPVRVGRSVQPSLMDRTRRVARV